MFKTNEFSKIQFRVYQDQLIFINKNHFKNRNRNSKDLQPNGIELAAEELDMVMEQNQIIEVPKILEYFGMDQKYVEQ